MGKTKERDAKRCSPADGSINGFADNLRKYCARQRKYRASVREIRKIRVERVLLPPFVRNFFPSSEEGGEREGKEERSGKIGNGSTFLADESELASIPFSFIHHATPFRYHLLLPKASLYCNLVLRSSHSTRFFGSARLHVAGDS